MNTSKGEQYVVNEKGNATAVILPIETYKKILAILEEVEGRKETKILSQSVEWKWQPKNDPSWQPKFDPPLG